MKCPNCGVENSEDNKFCSNCGFELKVKEKPVTPPTVKKKEEYTKKSPAAAPQRQTTAPKPVDKPKDKKIFIFLAIIAILAVIGIYYATSSIFTPITPQNATVFIDTAVSGSAQLKDPTNNKTYTISIDYYGLSSGSGFIISKDGYLITAAHVVADPWTLSRKNKIKKMTEDDIKWYVDRAAVAYFMKKKYPKEYNNLTSTQLDDLADNFITAGYVRALNYEHNIYIRGPAFPNSVNDPAVARIVDSGDSSNEIDIALLKIDRLNGTLPALSISSQTPTTGQSIKIYGYPTEQFEFYNSLSQSGQKKAVWDSMLVSTLTTGIVSGERISPKGISYFQTDASTDHGSSGGPVCDNDNKVIGVLVMGFEKQGYNFFLPSKYVIEMCKNNGVNV